MTSVLTADQWLYERLTNDAALAALIGNRVFVDKAPSGTRYPFIEMALVDAPVRRGVGTAIIWFDELWQVKAITNQNLYEDIGEIMDRVLVLLDASSGSAGDGVVVGCTARRMFRFHEVEHGKIYKHLGWEFRVWTQ